MFKRKLVGEFCSVNHSVCRHFPRVLVIFSAARHRHKPLTARAFYCLISRDNRTCTPDISCFLQL